MTETNNEGTIPSTDTSAMNPFATQPIAAQAIPVTETPAPEVPAATPPTPAEAAPPVVQEVITEAPKAAAPAAAAASTAFANEFSEKAFKYLQEGKMDDLLTHLSEQKTLASVDTMDAEAAIKLRLQYDNPDYTSEDIEGLFEETFARPEKPEQAIDELDEEYATRVEKWEKKNKAFDNKLLRESKSAKKVLAAKKSELILPDIQANVPVAPEPTAEQIAQQAKEQQAAVQAYYQTIEKGLAEFNGYTTEVEFDKGVKFPVSFIVDANDKPAFQQTLQQFNVNEYFGKRWIGEDGAFNGRQFAEDVFWITNRELIAKRMASEGANRRYEEYLKVKNNVDFNGGRQQPLQQHTDETDKMASYFFSAR
jgi:hypothetical protein